VSSKVQEFESKLDETSSIRDLRQAAKEILGGEVAWSWDLPRTREGYYHYDGSIEVRWLLSISRSTKYAAGCG
jgi:hypothetical protein